MEYESIYYQLSQQKPEKVEKKIVENERFESEGNKENVLERETSIYEQQSTTVYANTSESGADITSQNEMQNFTYSAQDKKLSFIGNDATYLTSELIYQFGLKTLVLDVSFNCFSDLRDLEQFPNLEELVCDNNLISETTHFPRLETLKLFSCNKNKITDIHTFIDRIKISFPNLTYLSMLGNVACPNQLIDESKDEYDYSKYRKYVLFRLKKLKFLDCYEVTKHERDELANEPLFPSVVTYKEEDIEKQSAERDQTDESASSFYTPLPRSDLTEEPVSSQSSFGYCKYVYYGKQSEGNRFIRNDDL